MYRCWRSLAVALVLLQPLFFLSVQAHHSFTAEYDSQRPVVVAGVISKVEWTNPHVWIEMEGQAVHSDARPEDVNKATWRFWEDSAAILQRKGFSQDALQVGDRVKIYGFRARDGSPRASAGRIVKEDGTQVFASPDEEGAGES